MLINFNPLNVTSPYGKRTRNGKEEFHPGIDIRVVDEKWKVYPILAPEDVTITRVFLDKQWGHAIYAKLENDNDVGVDEFRFWHVKPDDGCVIGAEIKAGEIIGIPESGYVSLHLHFECRSGGKTIDPILYLNDKNIKHTGA